MSPSNPSLAARLFKSMAVIEDFELRAAILSMMYFFFLFGSYSVVKPVRDAMGTVYGGQAPAGAVHGDFPRKPGVCATVRGPRLTHPALDLSALGVRLSLPHGPVVLRSVPGRHGARAAALGVRRLLRLVSTFNILIISVFWSFMADLFSRTQAKRLFGSSRRAARSAALSGR